MGYLTVLDAAPPAANLPTGPVALAAGDRAPAIADLIDHWATLHASLVASTVADEVIEAAELWAREAFELILSEPRPPRRRRASGARRMGRSRP